MNNTDKAYRKAIVSRRWREMRRRKLSAQPLCERCLSEGRLTPATEVHHIRPCEDAPTPTAQLRLLFDPHNLRSLCHRCHVETHIELGRSNKERTKRVAEAGLEAFKKAYDISNENVND